jgi:hypothetical protein
VASITETVVFPVPPFILAIEIIFPIYLIFFVQRYNVSMF